MVGNALQLAVPKLQYPMHLSSKRFLLPGQDDGAKWRQRVGVWPLEKPDPVRVSSPVLLDEVLFTTLCTVASLLRLLWE